MAPEPLGRTSMTTRYAVERAGRMLAERDDRHVCVDAGELTPRPWPAWLPDRLAPFVRPRPAGEPHRGGRRPVASPACASPSSPAPRAASARRPRGASRASRARSSCSSRAARSGCARSPAQLGARATVRRRRPHRRGRAGARARRTSSEPTAASTCSSTTPAPPGAATFADGGYANVRRTMELNFDAQVRLTEALLPLLRARGAERDRQRREHRGPRRARRHRRLQRSKFALAGWTDALHLEERRTACTSGSCCPGFIATEGFPQPELRRAPRTRWMVSTPEKVAEAIIDAGPGGSRSATCRAPTRSSRRCGSRPAAGAPGARASGRADVLTTRTGADARRRRTAARPRASALSTQVRATCSGGTVNRSGIPGRPGARRRGCGRGA